MPAVESLLRSCKPGGMVLLGFPNVMSLKGMVAKLTPMWFHWAVYRLIYGKKKFRDDGVAIFPTFLRMSIAPEKLKELANERGFESVSHEIYESGVQRRFSEKFLIGGRLAGPLEFLVRVLSLGSLT